MADAGVQLDRRWKRLGAGRNDDVAQRNALHQIKQLNNDIERRWTESQQLAFILRLLTTPSDRAVRPSNMCYTGRVRSLYTRCDLDDQMTTIMSTTCSRATRSVANDLPLCNTSTCADTPAALISHPDRPADGRCLHSFSRDTGQNVFILFLLIAIVAILRAFPADKHWLSQTSLCIIVWQCLGKKSNILNIFYSP